MKTALRDVEEDRGIAADFDPRQQEVDRDQDECRPGPGAGEAASHIGRKQIPARPVVPDGGDGIERGLRGRWHGHSKTTGLTFHARIVWPEEILLAF